MNFKPAFATVLAVLRGLLLCLLLDAITQAAGADPLPPDT
jgi:hypothetical protein